MVPVSEFTPSQWAFVALILLAPIPSLWAIWDAFKRDFPTPQEKKGWLVLAIFVPILGGLAYILFGRKRGVRV